MYSLEVNLFTDKTVSPLFQNILPKFEYSQGEKEGVKTATGHHAVYPPTTNELIKLPPLLLAVKTTRILQLRPASKPQANGWGNKAHLSLFYSLFIKS